MLELLRREIFDMTGFGNHIVDRSFTCTYSQAVFDVVQKELQELLKSSMVVNTVIRNDSGEEIEYKDVRFTRYFDPTVGYITFKATRKQGYKIKQDEV